MNLADKSELNILNIKLGGAVAQADVSLKKDVNTQDDEDIQFNQQTEIVRKTSQEKSPNLKRNDDSYSKDVFEANRNNTLSNVAKRKQRKGAESVERSLGDSVRSDAQEIKRYTQIISAWYKKNKFLINVDQNEKVVVLITITRQGKLVDAQIAESSGLREVDEAAIRMAYMADPFPPIPRDLAEDKKFLKFKIAAVFSPQ